MISCVSIHSESLQATVKLTLYDFKCDNPHVWGPGGEGIVKKDCTIESGKNIIFTLKSYRKTVWESRKNICFCRRLTKKKICTEIIFPYPNLQEQINVPEQGKKNVLDAQS